MIRNLFLLIFSSVIFLPVVGQNYNYVHYTTLNGLAGSVVYSMVQDHDGFIWFGTESGLSRFDGSRFKNFTSADGLPDNEIIQLYVDVKNRIWMIPFKGSVCFYSKGVIHTPENDSLLRRLHVNDEIISILGNAKGDVSILQPRSIKVIKDNDEIIVLDKFQPNRGDFFTGVGLKDSNTFQYAARVNKVCSCLFEYVKGDLVKIRNVDSNAFNSRTSFYLSPDLEIMSTKGGLLFYSSVTGQISLVPVEGGFLKMDRLNDSLVALNYSSAVRIYNFRRQTMENYFFKGENVNGTLEDSEGNLWFSTMGHGLYRLPSKEFKRYQFLYESSPLPVYVLKKYGDILYVGTDHFKLWKVNAQTGEMSSRQLYTQVSAGRITIIDKNSQGLFVGGDRVFTRINGQRISYFSSNSAFKSVCLSKDTILVGFNQGITPLHTETWKNGPAIWNGRVTAMYQQGKKIFIGTLIGAYILDSRQDTLFLGNLSKVLGSRIVAITGSDDGIVWIATHGDGVAGYRDGKIVSLLNEQKGLTSNICQTLFVRGHELWIGTDKGLNKVNLSDSNYRVTRYTMADGLMSNMVNTIFVDSNIVYVGTPEGISFFDESKVFTRSMCVLKMLAIKSGVNSWLYDTTGMQFNHYDNNIRFEFSGISFKSGGEMEYRYRLKGLSDLWLTTHDNFIEYAGLASGEYELELRAKNKFDVQSEPIIIKFTIRKLLWEKTWFRVVIILLLVSAIWILINIRIRKIRKQEKIKSETAQKIADLEQMALKAQMNPHFIFNSLNSIQQYVMDKDIRAANKFITDFSRLIRQTLEISSQPAITLQEEINYISTYLKLEKIRYESKFNYHILVADNIDVSILSIPPMILQPYIENSVRHGVRYRDDDEGMITVEFKTDQRNLICIVEDNGVGRKASAQMKGAVNIEYQSKGMNLTARRIEMMNSRHEFPIFVDVQDADSGKSMYVGTRVTINVSIINNAQTTL